MGVMEAIMRSLGFGRRDARQCERTKTMAAQGELDDTEADKALAELEKSGVRQRHEALNTAAVVTAGAFSLRRRGEIPEAENDEIALVTQGAIARLEAARRKQ